MSANREADPFFTICIINYNYETFLPDCIDSALAQDNSDFELLVVDDASTDGSRDVIARYGERVRPILKEKNCGHGDGFNRGFAAARGEVVIFLDADDFLYPHALSTLRANVRADAALYQWRMDIVDRFGTRLGQHPGYVEPLDAGDVRPALLNAARYATTVTSGMAFSRAALAKVLPMEAERFRQGGDGYLATVAPLYGDVVVVPGVLSAYRQHGANHSQFGATLANRARWRLAHDEARREALTAHARASGLAMAENPLLNDLHHVTERLISLRFDPARHPYGETRRDLLRVAHRLASQQPPAKRAYLRTWWTLAAMAPDPIARRLISWRVLASTRPAWMLTLIRGGKSIAGLR